MFLEEGDIIRILETDGRLSGPQIFVLAATPTRTQNYLKSGAKRTNRNSIHRPKLLEVLRERVRFPWSSAAQNTIDDIDAYIKEGRITDIFKRYTFLVDSLADKFQLAVASKTPLTNEQWGIVLISLSYCTAIAFATESTLITAEVRKNLSLARATALKHLASFAKYKWAQILIHRIETNAIGELWNATPMDARDTPAMRELIKQADYIGRAIAFHDEVAPTDHRVCFGPLSVASRFRWDEFYKPLWNRLKAADSRFEDPHAIDDPLLDEDFHHFLEWVTARKGNS